MMQINITDIGGYEDNYYDCECTIEPDKDGNIHSYVNAMVKALQLQGFLDKTIKSGFEQAIYDIQETIDVNSIN